MSGNGADIGAVYQLLMQVAETVGATVESWDSLDRRMQSVEHRPDGVERRLDGFDHRLDDLTAGLAGLRRAVTEYHASVLGHGIPISELDERVRRIELHLNLPPVA